MGKGDSACRLLRLRKIEHFTWAGHAPAPYGTHLHTNSTCKFCMQMLHTYCTEEALYRRQFGLSEQWILLAVPAEAIQRPVPQRERERERERERGLFRFA